MNKQLATAYCIAKEVHPGQPRVLYNGAACTPQCNRFAVVKIDHGASRWETFERWREGVAGAVERGHKVKLFREGKSHWILHFAPGRQWVQVGAQAHTPVSYTLMRKFHSFSGAGTIIEHHGRLTKLQLNELLVIMERLDREAP